MGVGVTLGLDEIVGVGGKVGEFVGVGIEGDSLGMAGVAETVGLKLGAIDTCGETDAVA